MNTETLKQKSLKLRVVMDSLKNQVPEDMKLSIELKPLLKAADQKLINMPMQWRIFRAATCSPRMVYSNTPNWSMLLRSFV